MSIFFNVNFAFAADHQQCFEEEMVEIIEDTFFEKFKDWSYTEINFGYRRIDLLAASGIILASIYFDYSVLCNNIMCLDNLLGIKISPNFTMGFSCAALESFGVAICAKKLRKWIEKRLVVNQPDNA